MLQARDVVDAPAYARCAWHDLIFNEWQNGAEPRGGCTRAFIMINSCVMCVSTYVQCTRVGANGVFMREYTIYGNAVCLSDKRF